MRYWPGTIVLAAFLLGSRAAAGPAAPQHRVQADRSVGADTALTGRALRCQENRIASFTCHNVELLAYLPSSATGFGGGDLWGWTDSTTGREFLVAGGGFFVEVTDPLHPKYLGKLQPHPGSQSTIPSVKVYKNHAFVMGTGLQIFDLTQLRDVKTPPMAFPETAHYDQLPTAHTLAMNEASGFLYAAGVLADDPVCRRSGLHMIDVRTPTKPVSVGCYSEPRTTPGIGVGGPGYVHDAQCVTYKGPDRQYRGREICINLSGKMVGIADVTDKQQPRTLSLVSYPNIGYAHQGWFTEDQRYFFLDDEADNLDLAKLAEWSRWNKLTPEEKKTTPPPPELTTLQTRTIVLDLEDLDDPVVATEYFASTQDGDHNLYIRGRYMYQGNTTAGLRIVDIANPKRPKEVGYLTNIGDAWGTYPFLKNNVVAVPTSKGLFLARLLKR